jgi:hypothetical protein
MLRLVRSERADYREPTELILARAYWQWYAVGLYAGAALFQGLGQGVERGLDLLRPPRP